MSERQRPRSLTPEARSLQAGVRSPEPGAILRVSRKPDGQPEIFYSLQGEGATIGTPSVFLRLALCNLKCQFCDTAYTWDWDRYDYAQEVIELTQDQVEERILKSNCPHLVITGGEPLLQQKALAPLVKSLKDKGFYCEVETSGTIVPKPELLEGISQWNVSPKLSNSGNPAHLREIPRVLQCFSHLPNAYFKVVIVEPSDIQEVLALMKKYQLPRDRIILMPEGQTRDIIQDRSQWLAEECIRLGFLFSTRLHILLWGDKRGK